jgi:hypothetical protein
MKIIATIVKLSAKRDNFAKVKFSFGEGTFAPATFGWGWLNKAQKVGHSEEIDMETFAMMTFGTAEVEGGVANTFSMKKG